MEEMTSPEEMLDLNLKKTQLRTMSFRKTIIALMLGCKDLEQQLVPMEQSLLDFHHQLNSKYKQLVSLQRLAEERLKDVEAREISVKGLFEKFTLEKTQFECIRKSVEERTVHMDQREERLGNRAKVIDTKEGELKVVQDWIERRAEELDTREGELDTREGELETKERDLDTIRDWLRGQTKELHTKEKQLDLLLKSVEERLKDVEVREERVNVDEGQKNLNEKRIRDMDQRKEQLENRAKELNAVQNSIERKAKDLDCKEEELELMAKHVDSLQDLIEQGRKELGIKEKELESLKKWIEERSKELDSRENQLESVEVSNEEGQRKLEAKRQELEFLNRSTEKRSAELYSRENQLESTKASYEEGRRELEVKEQELESLNRSIEKRAVELDSREKQLHSVEELTKEGRKQLEVKVKELEVEEKELKALKQSIEYRLEELGLREKQLDYVEECRKKLEVKEKELESLKSLIEKWSDELDLRQKQLISVEERQKVHEVKEKDLESLKKLIEKRREEHGSREMQLNSVEEGPKELEVNKEEQESLKILIKQRPEEFNLIERQHDSVKEFTQERYREFCSKMEQFPSDQILLEERSKELNSRDKQLAGCSNKFSPSEVMLFVAMDAKELLAYLYKHFKCHDSMGEEVSEILRLSTDPAKLVLDAMKRFYPPHLKSGYAEFEGSVVKSSCILLLEQLARISPKIELHVKDEAFKLAVEWKAKMTAVAENWLEVLGFLHLLAAYDLASAFDVDEILSHFELVAHCRQTPHLCRMLGFDAKIPDLVRNLVKSKQQLLAVRFICVYGLREKFPPAPLLKQYFQEVKKNTWIPCTDVFHNSQDLCNEKIEKRVAAIRAGIRCIVEHNLQSEYSPQILKSSIVKAQSFLRNKRKPVPADSKVIISPQKGKVQSQCEKKQIPSDAKLVTHKLISTAMAVILSKMGANDLQAFLNKHVEDHELMRDDVSIALQMSSEPAKLVLDSINGSNISYMDTGHKDFEANVIMRSCIFLLEELMKLSPPIKPWLEEEALSLAVNWVGKLSINAEDPLQIVGFLKLVGAYKLASAFCHDELLNLLKIAERFKQVSELYEVLGFSNKTSENFQVTTKDAQPSTSHQCELKSLGTGKDEKGKMSNLICNGAPLIICIASDPAKLVLDALLGFHYSRLSDDKAKMSKLDCMSSIFSLLDQLMSVKPEIKSQVKEEAVKFAHEWKKELVEPFLEPSEVLAFLQLLATYELFSLVDGDELLGLVDIVFQSEYAPGLCRVLGLAHKMPSFIQNLLQKDQHILALKYIHEFDLVEEFPPMPLVESLINNSEAEAMRICQEGNYSSTALNMALDKQVEAHRNVIKCIRQYGLKLAYSPEYLEGRMMELQVLRECKAPAISGENSCPQDPCRASAPLQDSRKRPAPAIELSSKFQMQPEKRPRIGGPAESHSNLYSNSIQIRAGMHMVPGRPPFVEPAARHSLGGSIPAAPYTWHPGQQYVPNGAANGAQKFFGYGVNRLDPS